MRETAAFGVAAQAAILMMASADLGIAPETLQERRVDFALREFSRKQVLKNPSWLARKYRSFQSNAHNDRPLTKSEDEN